MDFGPEISDLVVDYDPATLERRDVTARSVLERLAAARMPARATRIARTLTRAEMIDRAEVDGVLLRSHLELQRLHEEFRVGSQVHKLLVPMLELVRSRVVGGTVRIVDLGCGLGYILRWLAARGGLEGVELVGADYNRTLVAAAQRLADEERLPCRFVAANAFELREPAHIVMSTGVLHHFRGDNLAAVFAQHERSAAHGFVHVDIRPSRIAPLGAWVFHQARMREPLAKFDGFWSTVRAHDHATLRSAISNAAPSFTLGNVDARPGLAGLLRIFLANIGLRGERSETSAVMRSAYASFGRRFEVA